MADNTVYFANQNGWTAVYCHMWSSSNPSTTTVWPGTEMTRAQITYYGTEVWEIAIPDTYDRCLFDNNDGKQTVDCTVEDGGMYLMNGEGNWSGKVDYYADSYTVAGDEYVFGSDWNKDDTNNDMVLDNGVYKLSKNMIYWDGSINFNFKVAKGHNWNNAFPSSNYVINSTQMTSGAGYYKIDIEYTVYPEAINVTATFVRDRVRIAFAKNGWAATDLLYNPSGYWYDNINLQPDSQEFKMIINEDWLGYKFGNDSTLTRISNENKGISSDNNSVVLADVEGLYTFFYQNGKLSVDFPNSFTRTADEHLYYQTLCVPFDATISNADVYDVTAANTGCVTLGAHAGNMVAGHSYIIKPTATSMTISKVNEGTSVAEPINPVAEASALYGTLGDTLFYDHAHDVNPNWTIYVLYNNQFYLIGGNATATVASTKAHLHVILPPAQQDAPEAIRIIENATDIQNIEANEAAVKFIENGKLFIKKNGVVYDAVGAVVR